MPTAGRYGFIPRQGWATYAIELVAIAIAYLALAKFGLTIASINPSASPIWPPSGLALAAVLLAGYRVWPAILVGAFVANFTTAGTLHTSAAIAIGNSLEALAGGFLINAWSDGRNTFRTPAGVARFALICCVATTLSATIGVASLTIAGFADPADVRGIWFTWWLGDLGGALIIAPLLILWLTSDARSLASQRLMESGAVFLSAIAVGLIAFSPLIQQTPERSSLAFLAIVPLLWAAIRCGQRDTAMVAFILSAFSIWGTLENGGPFAQDQLNESVLLLLAFVISTAVPSLALSADVSERKLAELKLVRARNDLDLRVQQRTAELAEAQEQLAQSQKMEALGQLTGGIAHDFNNLLTIIAGHAQLLRKRLKDPAQLKSVEALLLASDRGASLTRQLLAFSRRQQLNPVVIDVQERMTSIETMLQSSLRDNIEINWNVPPRLWPVKVDPAEFDLALVNIAMNARDAMPDGGTFAVAARNARLEKAGAQIDVVEITLSDTGSGVPRDIQAKVFEPFFTTKPPGRGTGLGLAQVYAFALQSGGTVVLSSEPGKGTEVKLSLPRSHGTPQQIVLGDLDPAWSGGGKILLVDDNAEVAAVTRALLEDSGYTVLHTDDAADALSRLQDGEAVDLVLSDIVMPGSVDGIALSEAIRAKYPDMPVVLMTGYSGAAKTAEYKFAVLRKPYSPADLQRAIASAMNRTPGG